MSWLFLFHFWQILMWAKIYEQRRHSFKLDWTITITITKSPRTWTSWTQSSRTSLLVLGLLRIGLPTQEWEYYRASKMRITQIWNKKSFCNDMLRRKGSRDSFATVWRNGWSCIRPKNETQKMIHSFRRQSLHLLSSSKNNFMFNLWKKEYLRRIYHKAV